MVSSHSQSLVVHNLFGNKTRSFSLCAAIFCAITAIGMLKKQKVDHSRIIILIEASEESGSPDLPHYIDLLESQIGSPSLIVCLDSGAGNYEQLWLTSSLRGLFVGDLKVEVLTEGLHSGLGSGVVPSSFRIIRKLLERVEDAETGKVLIPEAYCEIPPDQLEYAELSAKALGTELTSCLPFVKVLLESLCFCLFWALPPDV